jgi:hypothetical protein
MTKNILLFFFIFFLSFNTYSQKFDLGIKVGPNFATQKLNLIEGVESITGYHVGTYMYIKLPLIFGIQAEAQYSTQGGEFQLNTVINKNNLSYINIPVLIRSDFGPINFHFGPQFGLLTDASLSLNGIKTNIKNQFISRDFSFVAGLGIRLPARFGLSIRYVKGLKNVSDINVINSETKNTMFQLSLKYSLVQIGIKKPKKKTLE